MNTGTTAAIGAVDSVFSDALSGISTFMSGSVGGWVTFMIIVAMIGIVISIIYKFVYKK